MTADLSAHGNLMGGVRKSTKPHKLKRPKKTQKRVDEPKASEKESKPSRTNSPGNKYDFIRSGRRYEGEVVDESPINRGRAIEGDGITRVRSERVQKSNKELTAPKEDFTPKGPKGITPPGPTARESAEAKSSAAKKGTKNTSTIKVAEPSVNLEEGPNFGNPVYTITDAPRQWNKNA